MSTISLSSPVLDVDNIQQVTPNSRSSAINSGVQVKPSSAGSSFSSFSKHMDLALPDTLNEKAKLEVQQTPSLNPVNQKQAKSTLEQKTSSDHTETHINVINGGKQPNLGHNWESIHTRMNNQPAPGVNWEKIYAGLESKPDPGDNWEAIHARMNNQPALGVNWEKIYAGLENKPDPGEHWESISEKLII